MNTLSPDAIQDMCGPSGLGPYIAPAASPPFNPNDPIHVAARRYTSAHAKFKRYACVHGTPPAELATDLNKARGDLSWAVSNAHLAAVAQYGNQET